MDHDVTHRCPEHAVIGVTRSQHRTANSRAGSTDVELLTVAIEHGVTIAMGTDIAMTGPDRPNSWGGNGAEPAHLVRLGMTPLQAIDAATATAPLTLGPQAPKSGRLEPGYDADVITIAANPLADITVLSHPEHITSVWTKGHRVKG
jgi:imidazolonepropionase-like amidohydrolase